MNIFDQIINTVGSQAELARLLNVTKMRVWQWKQRGIPKEWAFEIEEVTGGKIKAEQIWPKLKNRK